MIRKIIVPTAREYILQIPESFIGKNVEVLAFELNEKGEVPPSGAMPTNEVDQKEVSYGERTKHLRYRSGGYQFNREEANDYE